MGKSWFENKKKEEKHNMSFLISRKIEKLNIKK